MSVTYFSTASWATAGTSSGSGWYKDVTIDVQTGDLIVAYGGAENDASGGTRAVATQSGSTSSWTLCTPTLSTDADAVGGWAVATADGSVTVRVTVRSNGHMGASVRVIPAAEWTGTPAWTEMVADDDGQVSVALSAMSWVLLSKGDYNGQTPTTVTTPALGTIHNAAFDAWYWSYAEISWTEQVPGTRNYGLSGMTGCDASGVVLVVPYPTPVSGGTSESYRPRKLLPRPSGHTAAGLVSTSGRALLWGGPGGEFPAAWIAGRSRVVAGIDAGTTFGQTGTANPAAETDSAQSLGRAKVRALGTALETEAGQTLGRVRVRALGAASETDGAQAISRGPKTRTLGVAAETDGVQTLGARKIRALGTATETDSGQTLGRARVRAAGAASETDAALALGRAKRQTASPTLETSLSQTLGRSRLRSVGPASESDAAQALARRKVRAAGPTTETDAALPVRTRSRAVGATVETDAAQTLARRKTRALGVAAETDSAVSVTVKSHNGVGAASETDGAQTLGARKIRALGIATETDAGQSLGRSRVRSAGIATETDSGQALSRRKTRALGVAVESDVSVSITRRNLGQIGTTAETDAAQTLTRRKIRAIGTATETDAGQTLGRSRLRLVGPAIESDPAQAFGRRKARAIGLAAESDAAQVVAKRGALRLTIGIAIEADSSAAVSRQKARPTGSVVELDTAHALLRGKVIPLGVTLEVDKALQVLLRDIGFPASEKEREMQRRITSWFIRENPIEITLIPRVKIPTSSGGYRWQELPARTPQTMQLIEPPTPEDPTITADGIEREVKFILLGEYDATIGLYDVFEALDHRWEVIQLYHNNGYERRASVARYG